VAMTPPMNPEINDNKTASAAIRASPTRLAPRSRTDSTGEGGGKGKLIS